MLKQEINKFAKAKIYSKELFYFKYWRFTSSKARTGTRTNSGRYKVINYNKCKKAKDRGDKSSTSFLLPAFGGAAWFNSQLCGSARRGLRRRGSRCARILFFFVALQSMLPSLRDDALPLLLRGRLTAQGEKLWFISGRPFRSLLSTSNVFRSHILRSNRVVQVFKCINLFWLRPRLRSRRRSS